MYDERKSKDTRKTELFILSIISILIIVISAIGVMAQTIQDDNFKVTWNTIKDDSNYKEYIIQVQNQKNYSTYFDLRTLATGDIYFEYELYEYKDILIPVMIQTCNTYHRVNATHDFNETICIKEIQFKNIVGWKKTQSNTKSFNHDFNRADYGEILIPAINSKPKLDDNQNIITIDGTKTFKLILKNFNPIIYHGELALIDLITSGYYHPMINSTFYNSNWENDNSTSTIIIQGSENLNTTFKVESTNYYTFDATNKSDYSVVRDVNGTNHLTVLNQYGVNFTSPLGLGEYVTFNSVNDGLYSSPFTIGGAGKGTVSMLIKTNITTAYLFAGCDDDTSPNSCSGGDYDMFSLYLNGSMNLECGFRYGQTGGTATDKFLFTADNPLPSNEWVLITCAWNDVNNTMRMYFNTTEQTGTLVNIGSHFNMTTWFTFGGRSVGDGAFDTMQDSKPSVIDEFLYSTKYFDFNDVRKLYNLYLSGLQYPFTTEDVFTSIDFNTSGNESLFTPIFVCDGNCIVNITAESELFSDVTSGVEETVTVPPTDNNLNFSYTIELGRFSSMKELNISFREGVDIIRFTNITFYALNSSKDIIGNHTAFTSENMQAIEYMQINFTLFSTSGFNSDLLFYFTANGTNACSLGNRQSSMCLFYDTFVKYQNETITKYYDGTITGGNQGDNINCTFTGTPTTRAYQCIVDEHYNPNVFKWYSAEYDFSDVKYQTGVSQRITRDNHIKVELDESIIPLDFIQAKIDFRVRVTGTPLALNVFACNSSYTTGDIETSPYCAVLGSKLYTELQDDGTKARFVFSKDFVDNLGDLKYIMLCSDETSSARYYALKTYAIQNVSHVQKWNYTTNSGTTWNNLGDGYETELNMNWFNNALNTTAFILRLGLNETNSTNYNMTWILNDSVNYPPNVILLNPPSGSTLNGTILMNWTYNDVNNDTSLVNITLGGVLIESNLPSSQLEYNLTLNSTPSTQVLNLGVTACENETVEGLCGSDFHTITIPANITPLICTKFLDCYDGIKECVRTNNATINANPTLLRPFNINNCVDFKTQNTTLLFMLFGISMVLIFISFMYRYSYVGMIGGMIGLFTSLLMLSKWYILGMVLVFAFFGLTLLFVGITIKEHE